MERRKLLRALAGVGLSSLMAPVAPLVNESLWPRKILGVDGKSAGAAQASALGAL